MTDFALVQSTNSKDTRLFDKFLHSFIQPFLLGGKCEVVDYLSYKQCERLCAVHTRIYRNEDILEQLNEQSHLIAPYNIIFDSDALRFLFVIHNLFVSFSEEFQKEKHLALKYITISLEQLELIQHTIKPQKLLMRHLILRRFFVALRPTTKVKFWAGERNYIGTTPSKLLLIMPQIRRVRVHTENHPLFKEVNIAYQENIFHLKKSIVQHLLDLSPLTQFLKIGDTNTNDYPLKLYSEPSHQDITPATKQHHYTYEILNNRYFARAITDHIIENQVVNDAAGQIALNFLQALRESANKEMLQLIGHFSVNLVLTQCFTQAIFPQKECFKEIKSFIKKYKEHKNIKSKDIELKTQRSFYALILAFFSLEKEGIIKISDLKSWPSYQKAEVNHVLKLLNDKELKQFSRVLKSRIKERL